MNIVITGASGHIGYHVARLLLSLDHRVVLLTRRENQNIAKLKDLGAISVITDLHNPLSYQSHFKDTDVLFHLASENTTDTSDEERVIANTFGLTQKVIESAITAGIKTIIYTSSVVVLGRSSDPDVLINENSKPDLLESPYVKGKFLAEQFCDKIIAEQSVDIRRIYPSWVLGSGDAGLTPPHKLILDYVKKGQIFYFKGGISVTSVENVAQAHVNALLIGNPFEKYLAGGSNISFKTFYTTLAKYSGHRPPFIYLPKLLIYAAAVVAKAILGKKNPIDPAYVQSVIGSFSWYNSNKAILELNYVVPDADQLLSGAVSEARRKMLGLDKLFKKPEQIKRIEYNSDDVLLITGFPGWLSNRMLDILMNGDKYGNYAVDRKIRVLVQPNYKDLISKIAPNVEVCYGDITDPLSLREALKNVSTVYHLAGVIYPKDIKTYYRVNYLGTINLVDECTRLGIRRILFMSTDSTCGYGRATRVFDENTPAHPYKNYGKSKYLAEKYILDKTKEGLIDGTSLRGFWFFGPFMPDRNAGFFRMFYWKRQIVFGDGKNYRSISHIDNVIQAFIKAEKNLSTIGKWYWIGSERSNYTVDEIYQNIADGLNVAYKPLYIPKWICEMLHVLDSMISITGKLNATIHAAGKFHKDIAGDISAARRDFDYKPDIDFEEIKVELKELFGRQNK